MSSTLKHYILWTTTRQYFERLEIKLHRHGINGDIRYF